MAGERLCAAAIQYNIVWLWLVKRNVEFIYSIFRGNVRDDEMCVIRNDVVAAANAVIYSCGASIVVCIHQSHFKHSTCAFYMENSAQFR